MTGNSSSQRLSDALLSIIRQQRHVGTSVVIATQEPTVVPPIFLELASIIISRLFSSPGWWQHLNQHCVVDTSLGENDMISKVRYIAIRKGSVLRSYRFPVWLSMKHWYSLLRDWCPNPSTTATTKGPVLLSVAI